MVPGDLLDEVHGELVECCRRLTREAERLAQLVELQRLALGVSLRLGRRASVVELFDEFGDEPDACVAALVHSLRSEAPR